MKVLVRSGILGILLLFGGCGTAPINITQSTVPESITVKKEPVVSPYIERWTVTYERQGPEAPIAVAESVPQHPECPQFDMPAVGNPPGIPELDRGRRGDYEYIAESLLNHVRELMEYNQGVQHEFALAYKRYVAQCKRVD